MGKRKGKDEAAAPTAPQVHDVRPVDVQPVYSFPSEVRCPRCGAAGAHVAGTHDGIRYMSCERGVCRHRWKVVGEPI
jgi:formate dehydrogenase maturation protein FdhE